MNYLKKWKNNFMYIIYGMYNMTYLYEKNTFEITR